MCCRLFDTKRMMTSSNGNIFRVTGHLCGEFTGLRWIPRTKASDAELWCFLWCARLSKHSRGWWFETLSHPLWRHRNGLHELMLYDCQLHPYEQTWTILWTNWNLFKDIMICIQGNALEMSSKMSTISLLIVSILVGSSIFCGNGTIFMILGKR